MRINNDGLLGRMKMFSVLYLLIIGYFLGGKRKYKEEK